MYSETTSAELTIHQFYKIGGCEISPWHYTSGSSGRRLPDLRIVLLSCLKVDVISGKLSLDLLFLSSQLVTAKLRELRVNARIADRKVEVGVFSPDSN